MASVEGSDVWTVPGENEIEERLHALISAVLDPDDPASNYGAVEELLGNAFQIDVGRVYCASVSKPGNLRVRMTQSNRARTAELEVAIARAHDHVDGNVRASEKLITDDSYRGSVAICASADEAKWTIEAVVEPIGRSVGERIQEIFSDVDVVKVGVSSEPSDKPEPDAIELSDLVEEWRTSTGYPTEDDERAIRARSELEELLTEESLQAAIADPVSFDLPAFRRLSTGSYGGVGNQGQINRFLMGGEPAIRALATVMRSLLYGGGTESERFDSVLTDPELRVHGFSEGLATKCLAVLDPEKWIPLFVYRGPHGKREIMSMPELPIDPPDEHGKTRGQLAVESNDRLKELLDPYIPGDSWGQSQFLWWLHQRRSYVELTVTETARELSELADELLLDEEWLRTVVELLEDKRQVIFYGPPGTGKTYVARALARFLAPAVAHRVTVQFHPSYAYEDFMEGYRPLGGGDDGNVWYDILPGPLKKLAEEADTTSEPCVMVIDEINRGNVAKIFGELYYLLEYRGDEVQLQYGSGPFRLPKNLYLVGTMNTADRSIALLDAALRRRFHFIEFFPDRPPLKGLLRRWLGANGLSDMSYVADVVDLANELLPDRNLQIGPSHCMRTGLDREWFERIWRYSVMPYIEEQFYDEPDRVQEFELTRLEARLERRGQTEVQGATDTDDAEQTPPSTEGMATG